MIGPFGNPKVNQYGTSLDGNRDREVRELVNVGPTILDHVKRGSWEKITRKIKKEMKETRMKVELMHRENINSM